MRSTITVTDFIILLETTIPFRGFTIAPVPRGLRAHAPHALTRPERWAATGEAGERSSKMLSFPVERKSVGSGAGD